MTLKSDAKFNGKLTHGLKNDIRNLVNYHASSRKSTNLHFSFGFRWKCAEELCLKSDGKSEEKLALGSKNDMRNLVNFYASSGKSENVHFDVVLLFSLGYKVSAKKYRRIISHDTEKRSKLWTKTDFLFEIWHEEFGEL